MNDYNRDLQFDVIMPNLRAISAKQVLMICAKEAEKHLGTPASMLFKLMVAKETQSNSGIGENVAIPDIQIRGPKKPFTMLATLAHPIDFNAADNQPVDIVGFVLSPESDGPRHLRQLSRISRLLKNQDLHRKLHESHDQQTINTLLMDPDGWLMAA